MNLKELDSFKMSDAVVLHDTLNPALFADEHMRSDVRAKLLEIAEEFIDYLGVSNLDVRDITISGSNAAYSYTPHSDIDLHIIADMTKFNNDNIYRELFTAKKNLFNADHNIKVRGYDVELYVQDSSKPVRSLGEYSVERNKWIKFPSKKRANLDHSSVENKFKKLVQLGQLALRSTDMNALGDVLSTLKRYRQAGLDEHGEFGPENLAYKALRSQGLVDKLYSHMDMLKDRQLSLDESGNQLKTVTRIDSRPISDFTSNLKAYKHTDDWRQSGVDTGDDSYWKKNNLKTNTTKGLFAGDPHRTALYATGNAHETRYVEFTQNGQPVVYFDKKDLPKIRSRKTYLTVFNAANFKKLPTGEYFSDNPGQPLSQTEIGDPFQYITDHGWVIRFTDDLNKVFRKVKAMHKAKKIPQYGAEGMNEDRQLSLDETIDEAFDKPYKSKWTKSDTGTQYSRVKFPKLITFNEWADKDSDKWVKFRENLLEYLIKNGLEQHSHMIGMKCLQTIKKNKYISESFQFEKNSIDPLTGLLKFINKNSISISELKIGQRVDIVLVKTMNFAKLCQIDKYKNEIISEIHSTYIVTKSNRKYDIHDLQNVNDDVLDYGVYIVNNDSDEIDTVLFFYEDKIKENGWTVEIKSHDTRLTEASGYIPSEKEKNDPRFKTALTVDVHPDSIQQNAKKLGSKIARSGVPPTLKPSGKL